ncbi:protein MCM10 homolog [Bacillus rossius redtenbacheri]|uniref:protein MCM10 homolog n=1 Tax=Bacillus rossius redtenbacheri TaxID=93214 RepID=UPI002FDCEDF9
MFFEGPAQSVSMGDLDCDIGLLEALLREEVEPPAPTTPGATRPSQQAAPAPSPGAALLPGRAEPDKLQAAVPVSPLGEPAPRKQLSSHFLETRGSGQVRAGDMDSSDDEDNKYFEEQNYTAYGRSVKHLLAGRSVDPAPAGGPGQRAGPGAAWRSPRPPVSAAPAGPSPRRPSVAELDADPVFGIRMVKPLISSLALKERVVGRQVVPLAALKRHLLREDPSGDWVVGGVVVSKSGTRTSQKGAEYAIWRISDLKAGLKTASVFLFGKCFKEHWKTSVGSVVGILNPKPLDNRDGSGDEATLSVDNPQKVMIMGTSKDFGLCKARKKNGDSCTSFVNASACEYCVHHLQAAYKSCSRRMELQSPCAGRGLDKLRNKVLGKNEVFYGGQSFIAVPAKKSSKQVSKDSERLRKLSDFYNPDGGPGSSPPGRGGKENQARSKYISTLLDAGGGQARKDQERLRKLCGAPLKSSGANAHTPGPEEERTAAPEKVQTKLVVQSAPAAGSPPQAVLAAVVPQLGRGVQASGLVDLTPPRVVHRERAKMNALKWIHKHGPITREDPNKVPGADKNKPRAKREADGDTSAPKHARPDVAGRPEGGARGETPRPGVNARFRALLEASSRHMDTSSLTTGVRLPFRPAGGRGPGRDPQARGERQVPGAPGGLVPAHGHLLSDHWCATALAAPKHARPDVAGRPEGGARGETPRPGVNARFRALLEASSRHMELVEARDCEAEEEYFDRLEKKEKLEDKMLSTYKVPCKAVTCLKCKYTAFSASQLCKAEGHALKVTDGVKRFFRCGNCGNRTVSLELIPVWSCRNCASSRWERAPMLKEKKAGISTSLSIRGDEEMFIGSLQSNGNLGLLVPE